MPSEPVVSIAVACEAPADFRMAKTLVERVVPLGANGRRYRGVDDAEQTDAIDVPFVRLASVGELVEKSAMRYRSHGHFDGEPGAMDSMLADKLFFLLNGTASRPHAVIVVRDTDGHLERKSGWEQARASGKRNWPFRIVLGMAHPKRESWILVGFDPQNPSETARLAELRRELFSPVEKPHALAATGSDDKKSAKRVLGHLTDGCHEREDECLCAPLEILRQRGKETGLSAFLDEVEERLLPLLR